MDDDSYRKKLNPEQYRVMRQGGVEMPYTGKYWDHFEKGTYRCAACDAELFASKDKFASPGGRPTFKKPIDEHAFEFKQMAGADRRVEIRCKQCKSQLGYVIPKDKEPYYQVNSSSLNFKKSEGLGVMELKDKVDTAQDAKEKWDDARANDPSGGFAGTLKNIALVAAGLLVGGGLTAALVHSGGASNLCPAPNPTVITRPATSTPALVPAATTSQGKPPASAASGAVRPTTTAATTTGSSAATGTTP